jgi:polyisoprenoid-binding protein YceI
MTTITTTVPTGTWAVDPAHSSVEFQVKHLGIATVRGSFGGFAGRLEIGEQGMVASGTVEVATIDTNLPQRDEHLCSPDFFDAARHPQITFRSTAVERVDEGTFKITGELSMRGVTRELTLEAIFQGTDTDPWGNERVGLEVVGQLKRGDWGMKWNQALGSGNMLVSDRVKLQLDISAVKS